MEVIDYSNMIDRSVKLSWRMFSRVFSISTCKKKLMEATGSRKNGAWKWKFC